MVKHIVFWRLAEEAEGATKAENAQRMKELIEGLVGLVPDVEHIEVGIDIEGSEAAWDVALYSVFPSAEALDAYQVHPEHVRVRDAIVPLVTSRAVVDYTD